MNKYDMVTMIVTITDLLLYSNINITSLNNKIMFSFSDQQISITITGKITICITITLCICMYRYVD